jgi:hypothetical protein
MVQDQLTKAVLCRLKELGLPPSLIDLDQVRDHLFSHRWVMVVRDHDKIADVHLVQPRQDVNLPGWGASDSRQRRRNN